VIAVGRLFRARGNRGELNGEVYSSRPGRAEKLENVILTLPDGKTRPAVVEHVWWHDAKLVFKFEGIDSISAAEQWAGADVLVDDSERQLPEAGEYSYTDLIGCELWNRGVKAGVVAAIEEFGAGPLLNVTLVDGREALVPFTKAHCQEIDVAAKIIRAELPEGLLD
jgi:16S rRNA processing protein RimM